MNELNEDIIKEDLNEDEEKELEQKRVANRPSEAKIEEMRKLQIEKLKSMREKWNEPVVSKPIDKTPKTESSDEKEKKHIGNVIERHIFESLLFFKTAKKFDSIYLLTREKNLTKLWIFVKLKIYQSKKKKVKDLTQKSLCELNLNGRKCQSQVIPKMKTNIKLLGIFIKIIKEELIKGNNQF